MAAVNGGVAECLSNLAKQSTIKSTRYPGPPRLAWEELSQLGWIILSRANCDTKWQSTGSSLGSLRCWRQIWSARSSGRTKCSCRCVCNPCPSAPSPSAGRAGWEEEDCIGWPIDVEADDIPQLVGEQGSLESLKALMRSGRSLYAPQFRWHRARRDAVPTMPRTVRRSRLAGRLLDRGRHHPSTTSAESAPALLIDQTVDIFPDETLDAIDAPSAWICRPVG